MHVGKTSIFVLSLLLSYEAFGANASIRAGALRLNQPQNSVSNTANKTTSEKLSINDTLSSYNRASSLRPNRVQVSGGGNKNPAVNEEVLNKVYEEMERVTSAVEQELYLTSREIKNLKDEIAEKDEKIKDLELALEDYEEMKETVKNIPNIYYSKKEVDSKGYVMPSTLSSAIETAKSTVKKEALAEVNSKGFITSSAVADEIAQAKNAAVSAAVAQVENMNFATANSVAAAETRLANAIDSAKATITNERNAALQLYAKTSDVASEISLAKSNAIADAKSQTIAAIEDKNYATQQFVNTELSNLDLGIDEVAVGTIIENKLLAKDYATKSFAENKASAALNEAKSYTNTSVSNETTSRQAAINTIDSRLSTYATRTEVDNMVEEAVNPESIATGLLNNNQFKTELVSAVNADVSALSTRVGALEAEDTTINNRLATFSTKQELSGAVADINNTIDNLELGIDENVVIGIIDNQFSKNKVLTENSNVFTAVKNTVDAIPSRYYNMQAVDQKIADAVMDGEIDLSGYLAKNELTGELKNISDTEICLTKNCVAGQVADGISGLELGVDEDAVIGIIENKLPTITAFKAVKSTVDAIPSIYYNMQAVDQKIADAVMDGEIDLSGYLAKNELTGELKNISDTEICLTKNCVAGQVADGISGLELGVDEDAVIGIIDNQFSKNKVLTENSNVFTAVKNTVDEIPEKYALKSDVVGLGGRIDALEEEDGKINNQFKLYTKTTELPSVITQKYLIDTLDDAYVKPDVMDGKITELNGKFALKTDVEGLDVRVNALNENINALVEEDATIKENINKLDGKYVLKEGLQGVIEDIKTPDGKQLFITRNNVDDAIDKDSLARALLADEGFTAALGDAVVGDLNGLPTDVANLKVSVTKLQAEDTTIKGDIKALEEEDGKINNQFKLYTKTTELPSVITQKYLIDTLDDAYVKPDVMDGKITELNGKFALKTDVEGLDVRVNALNENINALDDTFALKTDVGGLGGRIDALEAEDTTINGQFELYTKTTELPNVITQQYLMGKLGDSYVKPDVMNSAIAEAKAAAVSQAATDRSAALADYVSNDGLERTVNNAIASNTVIKDMAADIQKNATAAAAASDAASAAQSAADRADAKAVAVDDKIGDLSDFNTGKGVTVAGAIKGVKTTAETADAKAVAADAKAVAADAKAVAADAKAVAADAKAAEANAAATAAQSTVQDLGDQLCDDSLQCGTGGFQRP